MKNKTSILIIILAVISIIGVVITQIIWIDNALKLKDEQFADKIKVSLKTIANTLYTLHNNNKNGLELLSITCNPIISPKTSEVDYALIDSLLRVELAGSKVENDFYFGVYQIDGNDKKLFGGKIESYESEILNSSFSVSLSCLYNYEENYQLALFIPNKDHIIFRQMLSGIIISALFVLVIGFSFIYVLYVSFKQKRISIMKNDFVNNMTHEFKTPISTISLSSEMLLRDEILADKEKARKYSKVIFDENQRLKNQVEQVLQIAVIEKGEMKIRKKDIDVHKVIADIVQKMEITISERGGAIKTYLNANSAKIFADKMHFTNVINNLLDNANKYTPDSPVIIVRTHNAKNGIVISIEDNGIGIKTNDQKDIFKQFHRVHTGNIHDVKGFGLGLFYVKLTTEAHGGSVKLTSEWGKGSIFEVFFPFNTDIN
jgi:two-component system phosphate regulon sensor histidine kinase PhoR